MHIITKHDVSSLVLLEYSALSQLYKEKIDFFEKKYSQKIEQFEIKLNSSKEENFEYWDDLIEWKANTAFLDEITSKIEDIKYGHFQVA